MDITWTWFSSHYCHCNYTDSKTSKMRLSLIYFLNAATYFLKDNKNKSLSQKAQRVKCQETKSHLTDPLYVFSNRKWHIYIYLTKTMFYKKLNSASTGKKSSKFSVILQLKWHSGKQKSILKSRFSLPWKSRNKLSLSC